MSCRLVRLSQLQSRHGITSGGEAPAVNTRLSFHPRIRAVQSTNNLMLSPPKPIMSKNRESIVFFHPDLGIGGAERLVIDAAVGLQNLGHKVTIFTSHCDSRHCFDEARDGK